MHIGLAGEPDEEDERVPSSSSPASPASPTPPPIFPGTTVPTNLTDSLLRSPPHVSRTTMGGMSVPDEHSEFVASPPKRRPATTAPAAASVPSHGPLSRFFTASKY